MTRAFTAIPIPEEKTGKLQEIQESLPTGNHVKPGKMHITFQFFKDLDDSQIETVKNHLEQTEIEPLNVKLRGLGTFPSKKRIRVIWAGVESPGIHDVHRKISDHPVKSDNNHEFRPHVTISRVKNLRRTEKKQIHQKMKELEGKNLGEFEASNITFYRSEMRPEGTKYSEIYVKEL